MKTKRRKLRSGVLSRRRSASPSQGLVIPIRWLKQVIAVFLLPVAWILTRAFFCSFSQATINHAFWVSEEFWFFSLGAVLWLIAFLGLPKPIVMYVFGHELTHALWVWLMGGKVREFRYRYDQFLDRSGSLFLSDLQRASSRNLRRSRLFHRSGAVSPLALRVNWSDLDVSYHFHSLDALERTERSDRAWNLLLHDRDLSHELSRSQRDADPRQPRCDLCFVWQRAVSRRD
jgi:hypothetical protein